MFGNEHPKFFSNRYYKPYGPIPVPQSPLPSDISSRKRRSLDLDAYAFIFNVACDTHSNDTRVKNYGKDVIAWVIFKTEDRNKIIDKIDIIEQITKSFLTKVKFSSELTNEKFFNELFESIKKDTPECLSEPNILN